MKRALIVLMFCVPFISRAQVTIDSLFKELRNRQSEIVYDGRFSFRDTLDTYEKFIKNVLLKKDSVWGKVTIIGQVHPVADSTLFFSTDFQRNIIGSQSSIESLLKNKVFQVVGNEGLASNSPPWSYVSTIDDYNALSVSELRYNSVARMYVRKNLRNLFPVESPYIHKLHNDAVSANNQNLNLLFTELRSYVAICFLLEEMHQRGYTRGALVVGTYHIKDVVWFAQMVGVPFEIYHTSNKPLSIYL